MKTERRHELQTNILADWLGRQIEALRPWANILAAVAVGAAVALAVWVFVAGLQSSSRGLAWTDYQAALDQDSPEQLRAVAQAHAGSEAAAWALLSAADMAAARGAVQVMVDRKDAQKLLTEALLDYERAATGARAKSMLRQRALFGAGQAAESLTAIDGDGKRLEEALRHYEAVVKGWPKSALAEAAAKRMQFLNQAESKQFYTWLAATEPKPPSPGGGFPGMPGMPGLEPSDGGRPPLEIPSDFQLPDFDLDSLLQGPPLDAPAPPDAPTPPDAPQPPASPDAPTPSTTPDASDEPVPPAAEPASPAEPPAAEPAPTEPAAAEPPAQP